MYKIFVAGHTGLIGSAVLKKLQSKNYDVIYKTHKELELKDYSKVKKFIKENNISFVILCAGKTGGILYNVKNPATLFYENMSITNNIFKLSSELKFKVIWYASSCIYPKDSPQPMKEEYICEGKMEETSIGYSAAKLAGLYAAVAYNKQFGKKILTLIPNTVYGNKKYINPEKAHVINALIKKFIDANKNKTDVILWGTGNVYREFIHNEDIADATVFAMENFENIKEDYLNVGTGEEISIKELADIIAQLTNFKGNIIWDKSKPDGVKRKLLDSSKFRSYGWKSNITLKEGIKKIISSYIKKEDSNDTIKIY